MHDVDPARFPRAHAYLASLPSGMASYPECTTRMEATRQMLDDFPDVLKEGVSPLIRKMLEDATVDKTKFAPDAWSVLVRLLLRDQRFRDDAAYCKWSLEHSARVFASPVYRVVFYVLSPTLVLTGAQRRWNSFRTGTTLTSEWQKDRKGGELKLVYPPRLYPELVTRGYAESFRAALIAGKAPDPQVRLTSYSPTETRYTVDWK